nr:LuxR C-terminal-related transcriptional regulator [uncultured Steroidobacter sp.]
MTQKSGVCVPRIGDESRPAEVQPELPDEGGFMNPDSELVFVVNAAECTRALLRDYIAAEHLQVVTCETAAQYLSHPQRDRSACVVLDVHLPDMCGLALQEQIAVAAVPVIFVARRADVTSSVRALKAGAQDFLSTPVCPSELVAAVRAAIERGRHSREARARVAEVRQRWNKLTPREREVMALIVSGLLNKQVASELGISSVTVQVYRCRTMQKMGAECFAELVRMAHALGIPYEYEGNDLGAILTARALIPPSSSKRVGREPRGRRSLASYRSEPGSVCSRDLMQSMLVPSQAVAHWPRVRGDTVAEARHAVALARSP